MNKSAAAFLMSFFVTLAAFSESAWNIDTPSTNIPAAQVSGEIFGHSFELGEATINDHMLQLKSQSKSGHWPDGDLMIFVKLGESDNEWLITPNSRNSPHIHMRFSKDGSTSSGVLMFTGEYSMYLKLTEKDDGTVEGKISVSLPDYKKSHLIGTFIAKKQ